MILSTINFSLDIYSKKEKSREIDRNDHSRIFETNQKENIVESFKEKVLFRVNEQKMNPNS